MEYCSQMQVKQSKNGRLTSNNKVSPIDLERQFSLRRYAPANISPFEKAFEKCKPRGSVIFGVLLYVLYKMAYYVWSFGLKLPFKNSGILPGSVRVINPFNLGALLQPLYRRQVVFLITNCSCLKGNVNLLCSRPFTVFRTHFLSQDRLF